jgi:cell division protein FtsI/penicillin-binding protein 2
VALLLTIFACATIVKLYSWQVSEQSFLQNEAARRILRETDLPAKRGLIMDSNGLLLASNIWVYNIYASPNGLKEKQRTEITAKLTTLLPGVPADDITKALTPGKRDWNLIASNLDSETADRVRKQEFAGIYFEAKSRRSYPNNNFLGHALGFANNAGDGAYGIEGFYDKMLKGTPGTRLAEVDPEGNPIIVGNTLEFKPAVNGGDVTLTIDTGVQLIAEREIKKGVESSKSEKGTVIVANPKTGEILAMASYPNYNPNEFYKTKPELMRDPIVSDVYEPGSTFKILTAAIGIDTGVVKPESAADLPGCAIKYTVTICNHDKVGFANQSVVKTLQASSNVGAMWIAEKYGPTVFYDYMQKFGIGTPSGVDLAGEGEGILRTNKAQGWSPLDFLTSTFGQGVAATPLQVIQAVSAVANDGKLMKPYIVKSIIRDGETLLENKPTVVRQVIKPETARTTTEMLVQAVRGGETRLADVKGYRVGKTGTTTIYNSDRTIGSTIAYAPADDPRFITLVILHKPQTSIWGSNVAAPIVASITEQLFIHYKIPPTEPVTQTKPKR